MVATPATEAPQLPGAFAAAVGAPPSTSMPEVLAQRDDLLGGIDVATPLADGVRAVGVDDERRGTGYRRAYELPPNAITPPLKSPNLKPPLNAATRNGC